MLVLHAAPAGQIFLHQDPANWKERTNPAGRVMAASAFDIEWEPVPGPGEGRRKMLLRGEHGPTVELQRNAAGRIAKALRRVLARDARAGFWLGSVSILGISPEDGHGRNALRASECRKT